MSDAGQTARRFDSRLRRLALGLALAIALHNLEEGLTFHHFTAVIAQVQGWVGLDPALPDWEQLRHALVLATLGPALLVGWVVKQPAGRSKVAALTALTALMLTNALMPHLALTLMLRAYTPGAASAILVLIPLCLLLLRHLYRANWLVPRQLLGAGLLGAAALPPALFAILALSGAWSRS